jgi:hypothetical protein
MLGKPEGETENRQSIHTGGQHRYNTKNGDKAKTQYKKLERLETRTLQKTGDVSKFSR